jgi:hypothetical protein
MTKPTKRTPTDQHRHFLETARELECDEGKERFEDKLGKIAKVKPSGSAQNRRASARK